MTIDTKSMELKKDWYDWVLKYGKDQKSEMRSGYKYATEEIAREKGEQFVAGANSVYMHYENPRIEVIKL